MEAFDTIELERNPELSQKYHLSKITGKENNYSIDRLCSNTKA